MKIEAGKSYKTRDGRKAFNPRWSSDHNCWYLVVDEASEDYHGGPISEVNHYGPEWWQPLPQPPFTSQEKSNG